MKITHNQDMNKITDAKIGRFEAVYNYLAVFFPR